MTEKDFRQFAERVKHSGLSTKQALDKFVKAMMQGPKLKIVKKQSIRKLVDGVRIYPDGHERCVTKAAWERRREELFTRANACCEHPQCYRPLLLLSEMHAHHMRKRSVGRDDRLSNLQALCENCHTKIHDEFKHSGART